MTRGNCIIVSVAMALWVLMMPGPAGAEDSDPVGPDTSDWPRSPSEEARWFIAQLERQPEIIAIREAYRRSVAAAWARLDDELAKLPAPDVRLEHLRGEVAAHGVIPPDEITSFDIGESIIRGLYGHLARQAKREALRFVLDELAQHVCRGPTERLLTHGCAVARSSTPTIDALQTALRRDLLALPGRLARIASREGSLPAGMACALTAVETLGGRLTSTDPPRTAVAWIGAIVRQAPCRGALGEVDADGRPRALEVGIRASRLLAAAASTARTPDATTLLAEATRALREEIGLPYVARDALERAEDRIAAIDHLLSEPIADAARERWKAARDSIARAITDGRTTALLAHDQARAALLVALDRFVIQTPLAALAGPVLEALGDPRSTGGGRDLVRGASRLLVALVNEARGLLPAETRSAVRSAQELSDALLAGDYLLAIDRLLEIPELTELPAMTTLLPIARLIAGLAAAKDAAQVDALIAEWAAPSTTWEARRKGILFTISGQFGLGASLESLTSGQSKGGLALGLAVPVGVDVSFPVGASSLSIMIQLLDLGAVGTARAAPGEGESVEPRLGLVQVLAPGLRAAWGIGRSPFMLSASFDLVPALRTVEGEAATVVRGGLAVTIDLPLLVLGRP